MQPGPFNTFLAQACEVDEKTVTVFARELKEAGLMTSGGRGRYAPHMRPLDAARVLIALMATDRPSEAVSCVERWRAMCPRQANDSIGELPELVLGQPTLEQSLVRILAVDPNPGLWPLQNWPAFHVARNEKTAMLSWGLNDSMRLTFRDLVANTSLEARRDMAGIRRICLVAPAVIQKIAVEMWADRFTGSDDKGYPLSLRHPWNDEGTYDERQTRYQAIYDYVRTRDSDWRVGAD